MKRILIFAFALLFALTGSARTKPKPNYELAERFSEKKVGAAVQSTSVRPNWFKNSDRFWYSWKNGEGTRYFIVDPAARTKTELFDMKDLAMRLTEIVGDPYDAQHIPIRGLELIDDDTKFRFEIVSTAKAPKAPKDTSAKKDDGPDEDDGTSLGGKKLFRFTYDIATRTLTDISGPKKEKDWPGWTNMSPDSTIIVYMKNYNLWMMDSVNFHKIIKDPKDSTVVEKQITFDGIQYNSYYYSEYGSDDMAEDSTKRYGASVSWSPDSKHFAVTKEDSRGVKDLWVINSLSEPRPTLMKYKYQMPGEPSPAVSLHIFDLSDTASVTSKLIKTAAFKDQSVELCRPEMSQKDPYGKTWMNRWLGDAGSFYITRTSRDLKRVDLCRVDVASDSAVVVVPERMNTYVETRNPKLVNKGSQVIWWAERNGWGNLYLYSADGKLVRNLTKGAFHVEDVLRVDEKAGKVFFTASGVNGGEDPYHLHTYSVGLDGTGMKQIDTGDYNTRSNCPDDARWFVVNSSRVDCAPSDGRKHIQFSNSRISKSFAYDCF